MKLSIRIENGIPLLGSVLYKNLSITHDACPLYSEIESIKILDSIIDKCFEILPEIHEWYWDSYSELIPFNYFTKTGVIDFLIDKFKNKKLYFVDNNIGGCSDSIFSKINHIGNPYFLGQGVENRLEITNRKFNRHFICLNRREKEHRDKLYRFLYDNNILNKTYFSYQSNNPHHPYYTVLDSELGKTDLNKDITIHINTVEVKPLTEHRKSFLSIVTETCFYENQLDESIRDAMFITEKTEKCIAAGQPFILFARPNFLSKLKEFGYKTFHDFWDESYDREADDNTRLQMVFDLILNISKWPLDRIEDMYRDMIPILKHNHEVNYKWYLLNRDKCLEKYYKLDENNKTLDFEI